MALIAAERGTEKENACPMLLIITKVKGEFRAHGFEVSLSKATVNRYIRNDMIGSAPLVRGCKGIIPEAAFKLQLLFLAVESFMQINQLNCDVVVNKMCGITSIDRIKENMLDRVMRSTPVSFDAIVAPPVEERRLLWTTYDNLHRWFMSFKEFCLKSEFAMPDCNGDAVFSPEMLRCIANFDKTELSLDRSETQAGGRPAMSYQDPHLPMIKRSVAKSSLKCTCIFGSTAAGECIPVHGPPSASNVGDDSRVRDASVRLLPAPQEDSWAIWS